MRTIICILFQSRRWWHSSLPFLHPPSRMRYCFFTYYFVWVRQFGRHLPGHLYCNTFYLISDPCDLDFAMHYDNCLQHASDGKGLPSCFNSFWILSSYCHQGVQFSNSISYHQPWSKEESYHWTSRWYWCSSRVVAWEQGWRGQEWQKGTKPLRGKRNV